MMPISQSWQKINEGTYRTVYRFSKTVCAKVMKAERPKRYGLLTVLYPMHLYTACKFGIRDMSRYEQEQYHALMSAIPQEMTKHFAKILGVKDGVIFQELVIDNSGSISKCLADSPEQPPEFWQQLEMLLNYFLEHDIFLLDLHPKNIMVKVSSESSRPVLVDFKRVGGKTYPFQPWLQIKYFARAKMKKVKRRLLALKAKATGPGP